MQMQFLRWPCILRPKLRKHDLVLGRYLWQALIPYVFDDYCMCEDERLACGGSGAGYGYGDGYRCVLQKAEPGCVRVHALE